MTRYSQISRRLFELKSILVDVYLLFRIISERCFHGRLGK